MGPSAQALVENLGAQGLERDELAATFRLPEDFQPLTREHFVSEDEERRMFELADLHHACDPPCEEPHAL